MTISEESAKPAVTKDVRKPNPRLPHSLMLHQRKHTRERVTQSSVIDTAAVLFPRLNSSRPQRSACSAAQTCTNPEPITADAVPDERHPPQNHF